MFIQTVFKRAAFGAAAACVLSASAQPGAAPDAAAGQAIAERACAGCHRVTLRQGPPAPALDDDNQAGTLPPTFSRLAQQYGGDGDGLRRLIARAHYPMPEPPLVPNEIGPVADYIVSLRWPGPAR